MDFLTKQGQRQSFKRLSEEIMRLPKKQATCIIGIDGCGGAGKSTFAEKLKHTYPNTTIIHMDDFYFPSSQIMNISPVNKQIGSDFDWRRMLNQVLEPISHNQEGHYQRYDWSTDCLAEWQTVPVGGLVIVEGIYCTRNELLSKYDFTIWMDCPREIRLARGIERDGEDARDMWEHQWMVAEDMYVREQKPQERANLIVKGTA